MEEQKRKKKKPISLERLMLGQIRKALRRDLTDNEQFYVKTNVASVKPEQYRGLENELIDILKELILGDIIKAHRKGTILSEPKRIDIHETLKKEMKKELDLDDEPEIDMKLPKNHTSTFLGISNPLQLQKFLNPGARVGKTYLVLDRRYHARLQDDNHKFTWFLAPGGASYDRNTTVSTMAPVRNIVGIEMYPFKLPRAENAVLSTNRISVAIEELSTQAFIANEERRRYHCMFKINQPAPVGQYDPLVLEDITGDTTEFDFFAPVKEELNSLTLTFGNPFRPIYFDPDKLSATISAAGVQTLLTFTQPHFMQLGDYVIISTFTTDQPGIDDVEIDLINDADGWAVSALTSTTLTIDVDLSGITGAITGNPHEIYLESKRFVVPIMLKYLKY